MKRNEIWQGIVYYLVCKKEKDKSNGLWSIALISFPALPKME